MGVFTHLLMLAAIGFNVSSGRAFTAPTIEEYLALIRIPTSSETTWSSGSMLKESLTSSVKPWTLSRTRRPPSHGFSAKVCFRRVRSRSTGGSPLKNVTVTMCGVLNLARFSSNSFSLCLRGNCGSSRTLPLFASWDEVIASRCTLRHSRPRSSSEVRYGVASLSRGELLFLDALAVANIVSSTKTWLRIRLARIQMALSNNAPVSEFIQRPRRNAIETIYLLATSDIRLYLEQNSQ